MVVTNIALQCIRTIEAAALNPNNVICENGLVRILMIINLGIVTLMALAKLRKAESLKVNYFLTQSK